MLPKDNRIRKGGDFSRIFKNSKPVYCGNLVIRIARQGTAGSSPRFGFIVSNKIDKRAARRNKLKRYLRNAAKSALNNIKPDTDIIIIVKSNFPYPYDKIEIEKQFLEGLRRAGVLR